MNLLIYAMLSLLLGQFAKREIFVNLSHIWYDQSFLAVTVEELSMNRLGLTNDGGDDLRQNQSKYLCCS